MSDASTRAEATEHSGTFEVSSPGAWGLLPGLSRPMSRWLSEIFPAAMMRGFKETSKRYGALLEYMDVTVVESFVYMCPRPVGAPKTAKRPPPKLIFKILACVHPEIRRRIRQSRVVFESKLWRQDVARWDSEWLPELNRTNDALQAILCAELDDQGLLDHLDACRVALDHAFYRHHSLNLCCMIPTGDFLFHATEWTNLPAPRLLGLLRGASPVSVGATAELVRIGTAIASDADSALALASSAPAHEVLATLRRAPSSVGTAVQAYLDVVGHRILSGYDVADLTAYEVPEVLVNAIRSTVRARRLDGDDERDVAAETSRVRELVPPEHRDEYDSLLKEARFTYRIRDERSYSNEGRTLGLTRGALIEAGRRLVNAGRLEAADHAVDLGHDELRALLTGGKGPAASDVAARARYRTTKTVADAPAQLGFPPSPPPPADWLPPHAARSMLAIGTMMSAMFDCSSRKRDRQVVHGLPASTGSIEGIARVVRGPECFARVQPGDILVASTTSPTYNVLLPTIGAIVTDRGGLLSHAAIVAREYGIPAVVGTTDGTTAIADGRRVRVDGASGDVFLI